MFSSSSSLSLSLSLSLSTYVNWLINLVIMIQLAKVHVVPLCGRDWNWQSEPHADWSTKIVTTKSAELRDLWVQHGGRRTRVLWLATLGKCFLFIVDSYSVAQGQDSCIIPDSCCFETISLIDFKWQLFFITLNVRRVSVTEPVDVVLRFEVLVSSCVV